MAQADGKARTALLFLCGAALTIGAVELGVLSLISPGDSVAAKAGRQLVMIAIGALLLVWIRVVERQPFSSIGVRRPGAGAAIWGVAGGVALIASFMLCYALILPMLGLAPDYSGNGNIVANPLWLQVMIIAVAAVVEEVLYRGYLIERVETLSGSKWLGFAVSVGVFTAAHAGAWQASQLIVVFFGAVIMGLLYLWKRDLILVMIAHFLADAVGFGLANLAAQAPR